MTTDWERGDYWQGRVPSKEECWEAFWDVIVPELVRAVRDGKITAEELNMTPDERDRRLLAVRPQPTNREMRRWFLSEGEPLAARGPIPRSKRLEYLRTAFSRTPYADGTLRTPRVASAGGPTARYRGRAAAD